MTPLRRARERGRGRASALVRYRRRQALTCGVLLLFAPAAARAVAAPGKPAHGPAVNFHKRSVLYGKLGINPMGVRQGAIGSCFVFATIASIAAKDPKLVGGMLHPQPDGTVQVSFADGSSEIVHPDDVLYARQLGFDHSDGLWVGVLMRAFAQHVSRSALVAAIQAENLSPWTTAMLVRGVENSDTIFTAWDRAVRTATGATGEIAPVTLQRALKTQLSQPWIPDALANEVLAAASGSNFLQTITDAVNSNPEAFGAYRAIGSGGSLLGPMRAWLPHIRLQSTKDCAATRHWLERALASAQAMTAASRRQLPAATNNGTMDWWVAQHAYSVLDYDAGSDTVTIRNPWGEKPGPDGISHIPMASFCAGFNEVVAGYARPQAEEAGKQ